MPGVLGVSGVLGVQDFWGEYPRKTRHECNFVEAGKSNYPIFQMPRAFPCAIMLARPIILPHVAADSFAAKAASIAHG